MSDSVRGPVVLGTIIFIAVACALAGLEIVHRALIRLGRRDPFPADLGRRAHRPARAFAAVSATYVVVNTMPLPRGPWTGPLLHTLDLAAIAVSAWLVGALLLVVEDRAVRRFPPAVRDNRHAPPGRAPSPPSRRATNAFIS